MYFGDLTYVELRDKAQKGCPVFIPLGCTEQQGPHLPVDFDTTMISALARGIAERVEAATRESVLVLPVLPFGPTPEHVGFGAGFIDLQQSTHEAIVRDVLHSLDQQGFKLLLVWRGCGQHDLGSVVQKFNLECGGRARAYQPVIDYQAIAARVLGVEVPGGHADSFATSVCLVLRPQSVRQAEIRRPLNEPFAWTSNLDFSAISDTGVIGDPTRASAGAGGKIWEAIVEEGAQLTLDLLADPDSAVRQTWTFLDQA